MNADLKMFFKILVTRLSCKLFGPEEHTFCLLHVTQGHVDCGPLGLCCMCPQGLPLVPICCMCFACVLNVFTQILVGDKVKFCLMGSTAGINASDCPLLDHPGCMEVNFNT